MAHLIPPTFSLDFRQPVLPGCVAVGSFDGRNPTLACGTSGGRAFLHSAASGAGSGGGSAHVRFLNINREITALSCARLARGAGSAAAAAATATAAAAPTLPPLRGWGEQRLVLD